VTPAGNPVIVTATGDAKPFTPLAITETGVPAPPGTSVSEDGVSVSEKSAGATAAVVVSAMVAVCDSAPEVPVIVTVLFAVVTLAPAVKLMVCATPAERVRLAGLAVTPLGSPLIARVTWLAKPFVAITVTDTLRPAAPPLSDSAAGDAVSVKSAAGPFVELLEPPQPPNTSKPGNVTTSKTRMKQRTQTLRVAAGSRRDHIAARAMGEPAPVRCMFSRHEGPLTERAFFS
jgi:hypothetical protein